MKQLIQKDKIANIFIEGSSQLGVNVSESCIFGMLCHIEILLEWGAKTNLTSIRDPMEIAVLHFLDSLTVFKVLPFASGLRILDVGTGAGFPGMVLRIADTSLDVALLDRDPKKIVFLKHVAHKLGIKGITFLNLPLDVLLQAETSPGFDVVVSRAVSSDPDFLDSLHLLLKPHGSLIRMAGPRSDHEHRVLRNFTFMEQWEGFLPFISNFRRVALYSRKSAPF